MDVILSKSKKVKSVSKSEAIKGLESGKYETAFSQVWESHIINGRDQGGYRYVFHTAQELK